MRSPVRSKDRVRVAAALCPTAVNVSSGFQPEPPATMLLFPPHLLRESAGPHRERPFTLNLPAASPYVGRRTERSRDPG